MLYYNLINFIEILINDRIIKTCKFLSGFFPGFFENGQEKVCPNKKRPKYFWKKKNFKRDHKKQCKKTEMRA